MSDERLTKEELLKRLASLVSDWDTETAHHQADELLLAYINDAEITQAFEAIHKWYA
jgi:hypothetical protein